MKGNGSSPCVKCGGMTNWLFAGDNGFVAQHRRCPKPKPADVRDPTIATLRADLATAQAEVVRLRACVATALKAAKSNALDLSEWQHIDESDCPARDPDYGGSVCDKNCCIGNARAALRVVLTALESAAKETP